MSRESSQTGSLVSRERLWTSLAVSAIGLLVLFNYSSHNQVTSTVSTLRKLIPATKSQTVTTNNKQSSVEQESIDLGDELESISKDTSSDKKSMSDSFKLPSELDKTVLDLSDAPQGRMAKMSAEEIRAYLGEVWNVQTIVGDGSAGNPLDEVPARTTPGGTIRALVFDSSNNLYYSDYATSTVRIVLASTGIGYTFAGIYGTAGNTGHNDLATSSALNGPQQLSWDINGNLLIVENVNAQVRVVNLATKIMSKVAGTGVAGFSGDNFPATASQLNNAYGVVGDASGNIYIGDYGNNRIRRVLASNNIIYTFAGTGVAGFSGEGGLATAANLNGPLHLTFDATYANLYFPDHSNHRVRKVVMATGLIFTVAGNGGNAYNGDGGQATSAAIAYPHAVTLATSGTGLYVVSYTGHAVRFVTFSTGIITTYLGTGAAGFNQDGLAPTATTLYYPLCSGLDKNGFLVVCDYSNNRIRGVYGAVPTGVPTLAPTVTVTNSVQTVVGNGAAGYPVDNLPATRTPAGTVRDLVFDSSNNLYYVDSEYSDTVRVVYAATGLTYTYAGTYRVSGNSGDGLVATKATFIRPFGVSFTKNGDMLVVDVGAHVVRRISKSTLIINRVAGNAVAGYNGDRFAATAASLNDPHGAVTDNVGSSGNIYIGDYSNNRIRKVSGSIITTFAGTGTRSFTADGYPATSTHMNSVVRPFFNPSFTYLYYPDHSNMRIRAINMVTTLVRTVAGNGAIGFAGDGAAATSGSIRYPMKVLPDSFGGFYIADRDNARIRYVTSTGLITTYAGNGATGFVQDNLAATSTSLGSPDSIALDKNGILYFSDNTNYRIRGVFRNSPTSLPTRAPTVLSNNQRIYTLVGNGESTYPIDGRLATRVSAGFPNDILFDSAGNLIYSDGNSNTIRIVNAATGITSTLAGTHRTSGYRGDGGPATSALLATPYGLSFDLNGDILIADYGQHVVRKLSLSTNTLSTVAGVGGSFGFNFDFYPATAAFLYNPAKAVTDEYGNLFIADFSNNRVRKVTTSNLIFTYAGTGAAASGADGFAATSTAIYSPCKLSFDLSYTNLYIPEWSAAKVRRLNVNTGLMYTAAGGNGGGFGGDQGQATSAYLNIPSAVYFDASGGYYIADRNNHRIRYVTNQGIISTFVGTGTAAFTQDNILPTNANIYHPEAVTLDRAGNVVLADTYNYRIRAIYATGPTPTPSLAPTSAAITYTVQTIAGTGVAGYAPDETSAVDTPVGHVKDMVFDASNNLYYSDMTYSFTVKVIYAATGKTFTFAGTYRTAGNTGHNDLAIVSSLNNPNGLAWDNSNNLLITDEVNHNVRRVGLSSKIMTRVAGTGTGGFNQDYLPPTSTNFNVPTHAIVDSSNNIYIADHSNCRVRVIKNGVVNTFAGTGSCGSTADGYLATATSLAHPYKLLFNPDQSILYVSEPSAHKIRFINMVSTVVSTLAGTGTAGLLGDGGLATSARLSSPNKLVWDSAGGLYFSEYGNHNVRYISPQGLIQTVVGGLGATYNGDSRPARTTALNYPQAVAFDRNGVLIIADTGNNRIRAMVASKPTSLPTRQPSVDTSVSVVSTVVGTGSTATPVEGSVAATSPSGYPRDLTFDSSNNLYYTSWSDCTVKVVSAATGILSTVAGISGSCGLVSGGLGTNKLGNAYSLEWDRNNGNLLITDNTPHTVRRLVLATKVLTLVAGTTTAGYSGEQLSPLVSNLNAPLNAVTDASGNIYIPTYNSHRVQRIVASTGLISTFAGTGSGSSGPDGLQATATALYGPSRVIFNAAKTYLYTPEHLGQKIRRVNMATGIISSVAGTGAAGGTGDGGLAIAATVYHPIDFWFDSAGGLLFADRANQKIRYITPSGLIYTYAGTGAAGFNQDGLPASSTTLYNPEGVAVDKNGIVYVASLDDYRIRKITNTRLFL